MRAFVEDRDKNGYFKFTQFVPAVGLELPFFFKLIEREKILEAREILGDGASIRTHVKGIIKKSRVPYNWMWSFYMEPESIGFFEIAAEVCDANVLYVEQNLDTAGGAFLPGNHWCPWSSTLRSEVTKIIDPTTERLLTDQR